MIYHGNILTQIRNNRQGTTIDSLTYKYRYNSDNKLIRNRLYHLKDAVHSSNFSDDIDDQGNFNNNPLFIETANNYVRDKMGRLVKDKQEYIDTILWTATNKVKAVIKTPSDTLKNVYFDYDAFGNQIAKHVFNSQTEMLEKSTYYLLDAQSNQLSIYEHTVDENESTAKYYLAERNIYGSSVLGTSRDTVNMMNPVTLPSYGIMGNRQYQLSEHRGNVLAVISDVKYPLSDDNTTISSYEVGIVNIADYSPFGVQLDGRTFENDFYRRTFQNQEHHDEIKGKGNYMNYKYRGYDPRIGRLGWAVDPLASQYPYNSSYAFSENRVIDGVELEGLEWKETDDKGNLKIYSVISIVTEGEGAIHNCDEIAEYIEAAQIQYNLNPQNISSISNILSGKSNEKSTFTTFNFNISDIGEFSASKTVSNYDENDKRYFLGTAIRMGKPEDFDKEEDGVMASYNGQVTGILLNPKYFDPNGDGYKTTTKNQRINALVHEIGHDFDLNHCGPDGKQSNKREDYPKNGFMALSGDKINKMTDEELNEIQNTDKIQNKE